MKVLQTLNQYLHKNRILSLIAALIWTSIIWIGCSTPGKDMPAIHVFDHFDKVVHFTFFCAFYVFWYHAFKPNKFKAIILVLVSLILGFIIEFYQVNFVAGRSFDVWDGIADFAGAVCGALLISRFENTQLTAN